MSQTPFCTPIHKQAVGNQARPTGNREPKLNTLKAEQEWQRNKGGSGDIVKHAMQRRGKELQFHGKGSLWK